MPTTHPLLVPRRKDNGRRDEIWDYLKNNHWKDHNVIEGFHEEPGPFNRALAINRAAEAAGDWEYAIIVDADSVMTHDQIESALMVAKQHQSLVIPHSRWVNVEHEEVVRFLAGLPLFHRPDRTIYHRTLSSILVIPRETWDAVNGFDERFKGWGFEDNAFMHAVTTIVDHPIRLEGDVFHLAHDRPAADTNRQLDPDFIANSNHFRSLYKRTTDATQLRRVISKNRVKL